MKQPRESHRTQPPRLSLSYESDIGRGRERIKLPFVIGILANLSGKHAEQRSIPSKWNFVAIAVDSFDEQLRRSDPSVAFAVPNALTGYGNLEIHLKFERLEDFSPSSIAQRVTPLRSLLEARHIVA